MTCAKNSSIGLSEIWEASLNSGKKISTNLVQNIHKDLVHAPVKHLLGLNPVLDFNAPSNLVDSVRLFFGGKITLDPLWNPSSLTDPELRLFQSLGSNPLSDPWTSPEWAGNTRCFLPLCSSSRKYEYANSYLSKLEREIAAGIFSGAY